MDSPRNVGSLKTLTKKWSQTINFFQLEENQRAEKTIHQDPVMEGLAINGPNFLQPRIIKIYRV
jgi:hypothetical protein